MSVKMVICPMCKRGVPTETVHTCPGFPVETFPRGPSNEQTLLTELGTVRRQLEAANAEIDELGRVLKIVAAERDRLQAFKDWCHSYLDTHGVPHHPPGPHGAEGCRIGDRMDWLMEKLANAEQAVDHIAAEDGTERDALAVTAERQAEQIKRLRESLERCERMLYQRCGGDTEGGESARAILKETAPTA